MTRLFLSSIGTAALIAGAALAGPACAQDRAEAFGGVLPDDLTMADDGFADATVRADDLIDARLTYDGAPIAHVVDVWFDAEGDITHLVVEEDLRTAPPEVGPVPLSVDYVRYAPDADGRVTAWSAISRDELSAIANSSALAGLGDPLTAPRADGIYRWSALKGAAVLGPSGDRIAVVDDVAFDIDGAAQDVLVSDSDAQALDADARTLPFDDVVFHQNPDGVIDVRTTLIENELDHAAAVAAGTS